MHAKLVMLVVLIGRVITQVFFMQYVNTTNHISFGAIIFIFLLYALATK